MGNKLKTHSGAKKRFKITGSGKVKYKMSGKRHLLAGMSARRGRKLKKLRILNDTEARIIKLSMPYN